MAAAFRHAARRLYGSGALRQTQEAAAVSGLSPAAEQLAHRRLSPLFSHTTEVGQPYIRGKPDKDGTLKLIEKKKEELYNLMAEAHMTYGTDQNSRASLMNQQLLQYLSGHVEPRHYDRTWRWYRDSKAIGDYVEKIGVVTLCAVWMDILWMALVRLCSL